MIATYTTQEGDTADLIAFKYYGGLNGKKLEQLLEANPGLADQGPLLPAGLVVILPEAATTSTADNGSAQGVKLWD